MRNSLVLTMLLVACSPLPEHKRDLDPKWRPLEHVYRDTRLPPGWANTVVPDVYTASPELVPDDLLAHERVHAQRQLDFGVNAWLEAYANNAQFRLDEEKLGYSAQIAWERTHGQQPDPYFFAWALTNYVPPLAITYNEALAWAVQEMTHGETHRH